MNNKKNVSRIDLTSFKKGEKKLGECLGLQAQDCRAILSTARAHYHQENYVVAIDLYEGLEAMGVDLGAHYGVLAACYQLTGQPQFALEPYLAALKLEPDNPYYLVNVGEILLNRGLMEDASVFLQKTISLDPQKKNPAAMRARALLLKGKRMLQGK